MRNRRVATLVVSALVVVLVAACIVAAGPVLMNAVRSMHSIPQH
jgi:Flp pilus assembly pilin Flp